MAKQRDKKLMLDMLRYNATVMFRDEYITVIVPQDEKALDYFAGIKIPTRPTSTDFYIIKSYNDSVSVLKETVVGWDNVQIMLVHTDIKEVLKRGPSTKLASLVKKYPSLYDAFGEKAKEMHCLPLIENQTYEDIRAALRVDVSNVVFVKDQTVKQQKRIIRDFPGAFKYMPQTAQLAKYLIETGGSLRDIKEGFRSKAICDMALKKSASEILYIPNPNEKQRISAVSRDGRILSELQNPSFEIKLAAVRSHPDAWKYIKDEKERKKLKKVKNLRRYRV